MSGKRIKHKSVPFRMKRKKEVFAAIVFLYYKKPHDNACRIACLKHTILRFSLVRIYNTVQRIIRVEGASWLFLNALPAMRYLKLNRLIASTLHYHLNLYTRVFAAKSFKRELGAKTKIAKQQSLFTGTLRWNTLPEFDELQIQNT